MLSYKLKHNSAVHLYAKNKIQYRQFYVSSKPVEKMTDINIPENTIVEDYLRKIDW